MFTDPLKNIRVAAPCPADWNEMYGDERKRFCSECKLNVYNLSGMTRREAERLIVNAEGRLCVRFFRRADGTVLTKNCPVGWAAIKHRVSRIATAAASLTFGFVAGLAGLRSAESVISLFPIGDVPAPDTSVQLEQVPIVGEIVSTDEGDLVVGKMLLPTDHTTPKVKTKR